MNSSTERTPASSVANVWSFCGNAVCLTTQELHITSQGEGDGRGCDMMGLDERLLKVLGAGDDGVQEPCFQIIQSVAEPGLTGNVRQQFNSLDPVREIFA